MAETTQTPKVSVSQKTFNTLLGMVMDGTWREGEKIPSENELRDILGVSRHTVRAAINVLSMLGILETRRGDGNYIKTTGFGLSMNFLIPYLCVNGNDIEPIIEFRESIESTMTRYAARRATEEDIERIHEKLELCERCADDLDAYMTADFDFHSEIARASRNELLIQCMHIIKAYYFPAVKKYFNHAIARDGVDRHRRVFDAIAAHDEDGAAVHMAAHISGVLTRIHGEEPE